MRPLCRELRNTAEMASGPVAGPDYKALQQLIGNEQLGLIATRALPDWRPDSGRIQLAGGQNRANAEGQLSNVVDGRLR